MRKAAFPSAPQAALLLLAHFLLRYVLWAVLHDLQGVLKLSNAAIGALAMLLATGILLTAVMQFRGMRHADVLHPSRSGVLSTTVFVVPPLLLLVPFVRT